jgi:hypothetical protein
MTALFAIGKYDQIQLYENRNYHLSSYFWLSFNDKLFMSNSKAEFLVYKFNPLALFSITTGFYFSSGSLLFMIFAICSSEGFFYSLEPFANIFKDYLTDEL